MPFSHIAGTGSAVPERILSNHELEKIVDTSDEWIMRRTGIKERRLSSTGKHESTADLGTAAARRAMEIADISERQIDTIITSTVTADRITPSAACLIQHQLEANHAAAFDVSAGCSGFTYGLELADASIRAGKAETVLVIGAERLSTFVNWQDRGTCVLFGDGAGAIVISARDAPGGILSTHIRSDGALWDLLYCEDGNPGPPDILNYIKHIPFHIKMEGNRLFKKAVAFMADIALQSLAQNKLVRDDIAIVIPHQANLRIIQAISEKIDIPMDRFYTNLHRYGNTSSASIPLAMDEAFRQGLIKKGDHVLLVSFGAGLTWGAAVIQWSI
ncbi:MAG: ketoacyl-ACP synthase III [Desulfatitalea sp.]|nr:ketoacyl-ACP synthase III [Desulfatitalea sp.]